MSCAEFWGVTIREVVMFIQAAAWRDDEATRRAMSAAWHTANLAGAAFAGKMPKHDVFLPQRRNVSSARQPKNPKQAAAYLEMWAAQYPRKKQKEGA